MLRCVEFVEQVTTVEEGVAERRLWLAFQAHRLLCSHCRRYLRQMRAVRGVLPRLPEVETTATGGEGPGSSLVR